MALKSALANLSCKVSENVPRIVKPNCIRNSSTYDKAAGAAKQGANEAAKVGQQAKDKASAAAGEVAGKTKDAAKSMSGGKAQKNAEEAWSSVKNTTQKIKDTVVGKAEEGKESVKANAENIKRNK
ncbi:Late embryogenesis abundant protein (LEA) family protein [Heracleum sosnowskyi]|uniref:Late embryogenesis abundant protein (LEA) family protein n=1 Tax=Heracleum sosnowskyi TaxID=360622 RepID=A0AAD8GR34_9APIA|nr:Late embryogenesis abundant protein (LEA) family protein [Heracleum sosnowskyi]